MGKFVLTNPPFLSKAKSENKIIYNKYKTNDLYKCFLLSLLNSGCRGGIMILPANFWYSDTNLRLRHQFLAMYTIIRINIFEEQVFADARVTVSSFSFISKKLSSVATKTEVRFYPQNQVFFVDLKHGFFVNTNNLFSTDASIKIASKKTPRGNDSLQSTHFFLQPFDCSMHKKMGLFMINNNTKLNLSQYPIYTNVSLTYDEQHFVLTKFNILLANLRHKYKSLIFPYFLSCKYAGFNRKKMSTKFAFTLINNIIKKYLKKEDH